MAVQTSGNFSLDALPEGCIANALSLTTPKDACRLSLIASTFHSAAISDAVWERFLPSDYRDIISRSSNAADLLASASSKKDLYFRICDFPVLIDADTKSFSLEKKSGKKCYMLAARSLKIVWGDTPRYWQWISVPESRFPEVAQLLDVCWFEICGNINSSRLSPNTNYAAYLVFMWEPETYGFEYKPLDASVEISGQEARKQIVYLDPQGEEQSKIYPRRVPRPRVGMFPRRCTHSVRDQEMNGSGENNDGVLPKKRSDEWMEVELGEFFVKDGDEGEILMSLMEIRSQWKSGMIIQGIEIRPKEDK